MELAGHTIRALLGEVAGRLPPEGTQHLVVLAGGSLLAWHGLRESTRDVDSLRPLDLELARAADEVGATHGLAAGWLNARAATFIPRTLHVADCAILLDHPLLRVLGAPLDQVFLMKLYAARDRDLDDLRALWPLTGFGSPQQAAEQFWQAYPHAPDDPYLANFIAGIAETTEPGSGQDDQEQLGPAR
ncbi:MAG: hypothetical protein WCF36_04430 [Candidatus Nanopelagicales bacterium]